MNGKIGFILFLVIILGVIIYAFSSGLVGKAVEQLKNPFHFGSLATSTFTLVPPGTYAYPGEGTSGSSKPGNPGTGTVIPGSTTTINPADIPAGFTVNQLSPYFHEVRFGGITAGNPYSYGVITLTTNLNAGVSASTTFDITGWRIKSNRSGEYIPQAINIYDPSGLTPPTDIKLGAGQYAYLYSSPGPFNLRLNECIGYLSSERNFVPQLPQSCPYPDRSALSSFTGACQNFIQSIGTCQTPDLSSPQIPRNDYACQTYLQDNFSYSACFKMHGSDPNFLSNQWWIWMGASPVDQYHDNVELLDKSGLVVDTYNY